MDMTSRALKLSPVRASTMDTLGTMWSCSSDFAVDANRESQTQRKANERTRTGDQQTRHACDVHHGLAHYSRERVRSTYAHLQAHY